MTALLRAAATAGPSLAFIAASVHLAGLDGAAYLVALGGLALLGLAFGPELRWVRPVPRQLALFELPPGTRRRARRDDDACVCERRAQ
jgi:hypothetical protein